MWPKTLVTEALKIKFPIIQAPMAGGVTTPELIAAVANAGALGSLAAGYMSPDDIHKAIVKIRSLTDKPFAVNLFIPEQLQVSKKQLDNMVKILKQTCASVTQEIQTIKPPFTYVFDEQVQVLVEERIPIFSFTFGIPTDKWLQQFKKIKTKLIGTATTLQEATLLEKKGIDFIVAQGVEAGGHRGTFLKNEDDAFIGNFALIPQIVDHVKIPVIAAGAIMDARGILAALTLGASAVQMGSAFIACLESGAHPLYKKTLLTSMANNTMLTRSFSGKWARGIKNQFMREMQAHQQDILDYPVQHALTTSIRQLAAKKGLINYMSMWAGQAAYLSTDISANELILKLDEEICLFKKKNG